MIMPLPNPVNFPAAIYPGAISESFGQLFNMTSLDLSNNQLSGESPG